MTIRRTALALVAALPLVSTAAFAQRDGAPGNPPSTATQRTLDGVTGNRTDADGRGNNPPGTAAERAMNRAMGTVEGRTQGADPPGTAAERAYDRATGSNTSGAYPSNSGGAPQR
jgi:hypothetical protein